MDLDVITTPGHLISLAARGFARMSEACLKPLGFGVGSLLAHEVAPHVGSGRLVRLLSDWAPPFPGFHISYLSRRQMRPVLSAFLDALRGTW